MFAVVFIKFSLVYWICQLWKALCYKLPFFWRFVKFPFYFYLLCCCSFLVAKSCPTLCDPMDCSPPGSSVHGILQARTLEWVAIFFSKGSSRSRDRTLIFCLAGGFFTIEPSGKLYPSSDLLEISKLCC